MIQLENAVRQQADRVNRACIYYFLQDLCIVKKHISSLRQFLFMSEGKNKNTTLNMDIDFYIGLVMDAFVHLIVSGLFFKSRTNWGRPRILNEALKNAISDFKTKETLDTRLFSYQGSSVLSSST